MDTAESERASAVHRSPYKAHLLTPLVDQMSYKLVNWHNLDLGEPHLAAPNKPP